MPQDVTCTLFEHAIAPLQLVAVEDVLIAAWNVYIPGEPPVLYEYWHGEEVQLVML
ncbi:MAG: hypothetical protein QXL94_08940 [Candidatus Parvarchaeum sp.]